MSSRNIKSFFLSTICGLLVLLVNIGVGLFFTRYLVRHLGIEAYGMVAMALQIAGIMLLVNSALVTGLGRFLTIAYEKNDGYAPAIFNTIFWTILAILFALFIATPAISYGLGKYLNISAINFADIFWLLVLSFVGYQFFVLRSIFLVACFVRNRLYVQNLVELSAIIIRVAFIILVFTLVHSNIWHVGMGIFIGGLASIALSIKSWRALTPDLKINIKLFDFKRLKEIFGMASWVLVNNVGSILFSNIDLIIINIYLGASTEGRYATILQWVILLRLFAESISSALAPIITTDFAKGHLDKIKEDSAFAVKIVGIILAFPAGFIFSFAAPVLSVWLGNDYTSLALLLRIMVVPAMLAFAMQPLFQVQTTLHRVRTPALVTLGFGILYIILALLLVNLKADGMGVAIAGSAVWLLRNAVFIPIYSAYIQKTHPLFYIRKIIPAIVGLILTIILSTTALTVHNFYSGFALLGIATILGLIYVSLAYMILLTKQERLFVVNSYVAITSGIQGT